MKNIKLFSIIFTGATLAVSCSKIDIEPQSGVLLASQMKETTTAIPTRVDASFPGMYTETGKPESVFHSNRRADDWGFPMIAFSSDIEAADVVLADSNYNWFSVCGELSSRNGNYANPYIRYKAPYNTIANANAILALLDPASTDEEACFKIAQARTMRAFAYLNLVPYFQFKYIGHEDDPCVPIVKEDTKDYTNNPRASQREAYKLIVDDLTYAIDHLEKFDRKGNKSKIDRSVAYGLRARAYLNMEKWAEAAADAAEAEKGYTPATIAEITNPVFKDRVNLKDISEHNWIWGYDMTTQLVLDTDNYNTTSAWVRSFSGDGYAPACACYACINKILYDKIPSTDVRKQWWVDENLKSQLVDDLQWKNLGPVVTAEETDYKMPFIPYANVKFGMYEVASNKNDEDWCYMRVEEMILIQVEGLYKSGDESGAKTKLQNFIQTYRDPSYDVNNPTIATSFENEIWFQRRVELWGEGFSNNDTRRLGKHLVRFVQGKKTNVPDIFKFNMRSDDGWWLLRFPDDESNTNHGIINNVGGNQPVQDQEPGLTDGVTD